MMQMTSKEIYSEICFAEVETILRNDPDNLIARAGQRSSWRWRLW
jgi:hypothetical protein